MEMEKLLVVGDEQVARNQLKSWLEREGSVLEAADRPGAIHLFLQHFPKVVVLDLALAPGPDGSSEGLRCLEWIVRMRPATKVVVLASARQRKDAYRALECGAYDLQQKPVHPPELQAVVRRAFHLCHVEEQSLQLKEALERTAGGVEGAAGQCDALQRLCERRQAAPQDAFGATDATPDRPGGGPAGAASEQGSDEQKGERHRGGNHAAGPALPAGQVTLREARDTVEKRMVVDAIGSCGGNMTKASELLGVSRPALYDLMKKYGICRGALLG